MDEATFRRQHLIEYIQNTQAEDGEAIVIGAALVVEIMVDGERLCFLMTSDASGTPLAWHTQEGLFTFARAYPAEFDHEDDDE